MRYILFNGDNSMWCIRGYWQNTASEEELIIVDESELEFVLGLLNRNNQGTQIYSKKFEDCQYFAATDSAERMFMSPDSIDENDTFYFKSQDKAIVQRKKDKEARKARQAEILKEKYLETKRQLKELGIAVGEIKYNTKRKL